MSANEAAAVVSKLIAAFRKDQIPEDTAAVYVEKLSGVNPPLLHAAVERLIETVTFFPSISEIKQTAARMAGLLPPSSGEAQAIIRAADVSQPVHRRDGSYAYTERYWVWPDNVSPETRSLLQGALMRSGEPCSADGKPHFGWETAFKAEYERQAADVTARVLASDLSRARLQEPSPKLLEAK